VALDRPEDKPSRPSAVEHRPADVVSQPLIVKDEFADRIGSCSRYQPGLYTQLVGLPWREVPVAYDTRERGHGSTERRTLKITSVARRVAFPHAAQAIQIVRRRKAKEKRSAETCYAITSLRGDPGPPSPARGHHPRPLGHRRPAPLGP
jgi:hypothetical protein